MSVQAPSSRARHWEIGKKTHPQLTITPEVRAWAKEVWSTLPPRDRVMIQEGLRAFAISDPG